MISNKLVVGVAVVTLLNAIVGSSVFASFTDVERSVSNGITAWVEPSPSVGSFHDCEKSEGNAIKVMMQSHN